MVGRRFITRSPSCGGARLRAGDNAVAHVIFHMWHDLRCHTFECRRGSS
ncbi:hypothetical protein KCH_02100 [Kitasatospora cheerisanensis KCTC 2395]|uniref:Uncharacterized protein n=1 Tax=Kitasatospora cheerisanensis KCTC 2395 TaxID=1348663 RepID=A0A066Z2Y4_9ACTN|nr:hypothetical protein KCH_02100 [Kitasatospora cheerisanensis KCTC 2395]